MGWFQDLIDGAGQPVGIEQGDVLGDTRRLPVQAVGDDGAEVVQEAKQQAALRHRRSPAPRRSHLARKGAESPRAGSTARSAASAVISSLTRNQLGAKPSRTCFQALVMGKGIDDLFTERLDAVSGKRIVIAGGAQETDDLGIGLAEALFVQAKTWRLALIGFVDHHQDRRPGSAVLDGPQPVMNGAIVFLAVRLGSGDRGFVRSGKTMRAAHHLLTAKIPDVELEVAGARGPALGLYLMVRGNAWRFPSRQDHAACRRSSSEEARSCRPPPYRPPAASPR